jgi:hypothetical protein
MRIRAPCAPCHRRDEAVAAPGDRLDAASARVISIENRAKRRNLNEEIGLLDRHLGPDGGHDFFLRNDVAPPFDQQGEEIEHRGYDKIRKRDFIYYNTVIKPALVGLTGPWISRGLEFNWPHHHRPTTFAPVDETLRENPYGSKTVWVGEREPMHRLQAMTGFTLYADRTVLEIECTIFKGADTPRSFLWWANPAVKGGDDHQSHFPPDVTAVFDHGKRDVSSFPIAMKILQGRLLRRGGHLALPEHSCPTSYMVCCASSRRPSLTPIGCSASISQTMLGIGTRRGN